MCSPFVSYTSINPFWIKVKTCIGFESYLDNFDFQPIDNRFNIAIAMNFIFLSYYFGWQYVALLISFEKTQQINSHQTRQSKMQALSRLTSVAAEQTDRANPAWPICA